MDEGRGDGEESEELLDCEWYQAKNGIAVDDNLQDIVLGMSENIFSFIDYECSH